MTTDGLSRLERGNRSPSWETVLALADALGVSTEAFRQAPAVRQEPAGRGRPRKAAPGEQPKRPHGRLKKT
jgi:transcriptional regulator with XRE-family HTH domain